MTPFNFLPNKYQWLEQYRYDVIGVGMLMVLPFVILMSIKLYVSQQINSVSVRIDALQEDIAAYADIEEPSQVGVHGRAVGLHEAANLLKLLSVAHGGVCVHEVEKNRHIKLKGIGYSLASIKQFEEELAKLPGISSVLLSHIKQSKYAIQFQLTLQGYKTN